MKCQKSVKYCYYSERLPGEQNFPHVGSKKSNFLSCCSIRKGFLTAAYYSSGDANFSFDDEYLHFFKWTILVAISREISCHTQVCRLLNILFRCSQPRPMREAQQQAGVCGSAKPQIALVPNHRVFAKSKITFGKTKLAERVKHAGWRQTVGNSSMNCEAVCCVLVTPLFPTQRRLYLKGAVCSLEWTLGPWGEKGSCKYSIVYYSINLGFAFSQVCGLSYLAKELCL